MVYDDTDCLNECSHHDAPLGRPVPHDPHAGEGALICWVLGAVLVIGGLVTWWVAR